MAIFGMKRFKGEKETPNVKDDASQVDTDNTDTMATKITSDQLTGDFNVDGIVHENLQQEVVEAIGQGSEDVKRVIVTLDNDEDIVFIVAGGIIKNIDSPVTNYEIINRLNWVDYNVFTEDEVDFVTKVFDEHDFFDALVKISEEIEGENGALLAELISQTYAERSVKSLVYAYDRKIVRMQTDWTLDSDTDIIEAYAGFNLDPKDIDFTVESVNLNVESLADSFDDGYDTVIYANDETDYENTDTDVSRYVLGAVQSSLNIEDGENGVTLGDLAAFSDGFPIPDVLNEVLRLLEIGKVSDFDPYAKVDEPEPEPEPEPIEEEFELEDEFDFEPETVEVEEEEYEPEEEEIIDAPYPAAIEGGTANLGGALVSYIYRLIDTEPLAQNVINRIEYITEYNSLFEQNVQGVETAMGPVIRQLERSMNVYEETASLDETIDFSAGSSSNLHRSVCYLEIERNDLNTARVKALTELQNIVNAKTTQNTELRDLIDHVIQLKLESIENVQNIVYGNDLSLYVSKEEQVFDETTVPLFYAIAKETGLKLNI